MKKPHAVCCARKPLVPKRVRKVIPHVPSVPSVSIMPRMPGAGLKAVLMLICSVPSRLVSITTCPSVSGKCSILLRVVTS